MKKFIGKTYSLQLRLICIIIIAIGIIFSDQHLDAFINIRTYMDTIVRSFYFLGNIPYQIIDNISKVLKTRIQLTTENKVLRQKLFLIKSKQLLLNQYKRENVKLRELLKLPLRKSEKKMITHVISTSMDPYRNQVIIDKGLDHNVYVGQPVINDKGIVGQIIFANKCTSRVLLICDTAHAIPIQVLRNDIRMIIVGNGCSDFFQLEDIPGEIDIQVGDILVASGLGGRFPEGYPVAIVSSVKLDKQNAYAIIQAKPTACLKSLRYLLLLWNSNLQNKSSVSPDEIRNIANERLTRLISRD